jgi:glycosyltransferase involved in cell wall biosynthesis
LKVLAWVPQPVDTSPGQRFRIEQWEPHLRRNGIEIVYSPFATPALTTRLSRRGAPAAKVLGVLRGLTHRLWESWRAGGFDLAYVFREGALLGPALAERILAWTGVPFVFDFDDAIWVRYVSPSNSYLSFLRFPGKTATLCRLARHVMVGNPYLGEYAARHNSRVSIVPTTIDTVKYQPRPKGRSEAPVIGWTGSFSSEQYLRIVGPALQRLRKRRDFRVVVVGGGEFRAPGVDVTHRPWRSATEVEDLLDFDIGLMPLPDSEWERGKCGLKALQYMALAIPPVVSPVGVNSEIVRDGENGFLARSDDEWEHRLDCLLGSPDLRARMGTAGRATVEERYSAVVQAPRVAAILREAAGQGR